MSRLCPVLVVLLAVCGCGPAQASAMQDVVERFLRAENAFTPGVMAEQMCADYSEISPVGDLDRRDQVLSFYAPRHRVDVTMQGTVLSEASIGGNPLLIEKLHYHLLAGGKARDVDFVAGFEGVEEGGALKVCHAQFTPFHPHH